MMGELSVFGLFFPFYSLLLCVGSWRLATFPVLDDAACRDLESGKGTEDNLNLPLNFIFLT